MTTNIDALTRHAQRRKLPGDRPAVVHGFSIGAHEVVVTVGLFEDGTAGEVFIRMNKEGSTLSGLMDGFAVMTSMALQYGVPLEVIAAKFIGSRFEPNGISSNPGIGATSSLLDYIFRWLLMRFGGQQQPTPSIDPAADLMPLPLPEVPR
jgi:ribonucleoside-diphosphate reductase alpha chain